MKKWQQIVIDDKDYVDKKGAELVDFIENNPVFGSLNKINQDIMKDQTVILFHYSDNLRRLISNF